MLLSRVASHELSTSSAPLVGRLTLLEGGCSLLSSMRSSLLVWERRIGTLRQTLVCLAPFLRFLSISLPLDTGGGVGPPTPFGVVGPLVGFIVCHPPRRGGMTEALWLRMSVVGL